MMGRWFANRKDATLPNLCTLPTPFTCTSPTVCTYDQEPNLQRGKDGHLTLHAKGSDDFFGNKASAPAPRAPSLAVASARPSGTGGSLAQQKFGSAKAISSRAFEDSNRER